MAVVMEAVAAVETVAPIGIDVMILFDLSPDDRLALFKPIHADKLDALFYGDILSYEGRDG